MKTISAVQKMVSNSTLNSSARRVIYKPFAPKMTILGRIFYSFDSRILDTTFGILVEHSTEYLNCSSTRLAWIRVLLHKSRNLANLRPMKPPAFSLSQLENSEKLLATVFDPTNRHKRKQRPKSSADMKPLSAFRHQRSLKAEVFPLKFRL